MISVTSSGSFKKTYAFLEYMKYGKPYQELHRYGRIGVDALSSATPRDTGDTAGSWGYQLGHKPGIYTIHWFNTNREGGVNVAVIIQYGHGTGTGGYVQGIDYINPALRPIFNKIVDDVWRQVKNG